MYIKLICPTPRQNMQTLDIIDIVKIIDKFPIKKIHKTYNNRILEKVSTKFTTEDQQTFIARFYMFINNNPDTDHIISIDMIWEWLGYARKSVLKEYLVNNFNKNNGIDYIIQPGDTTTNKKMRETILITINCFKRICLGAGTSRSKLIHNYYINLENIINETIAEQAEEFALLLDQKDQQITTLQEAVDNTEEMIITNSEGSNCVYLAIIEEDIINDIDTGAKFGFTTDRMKKRIAKHKKTFPKFELTYTINSDDHVKLERLIKDACEYDHESPLYNRRYSKEYNGKDQTELIRLDKKFTIDKLYLEVIKLNEQCKKNLNAEIKQLREEIVMLKNQLSGKIPIPKNVKLPEPLFAKCGCCGIKTTKENTDINPKTGTFFSQCNKDRATVSLRNEEIRKEDRDKEIYASEIRQNEWKKIEYNLLNSTVLVKCVGPCALEKLPTYFDVSKTSNRLYLKCLECRDLPFPVVYQDIPEGYQECGLTKCRNVFEKEFDDVRKKPYLTCPDHREKDLAYTDKKKKIFALQKTQENIPCIMKGCKRIIEKELNSKKDGYYQKCRPCRGIFEEEE